MAEWIWSIALRLRLHAGSWPTVCGPQVTPHNAVVHESVAVYLRTERQLAFAAFLALLMSRCGHRFIVVVPVVIFVLIVLLAFSSH